MFDVKANKTFYVPIVAFCAHFMFNNAQNTLHTFPRNFSVDGEVANLLLTCQQVRNKSATSRCNGILETT